MSKAAAHPAPGGSKKFTIRSLVWSVYAPSFLLSFGQGLLIPVLPEFAIQEFNSTDAMVGLAVAAKALGTMSFDVPAGVLATRFGLRRTMLAGVLLFAISAVIAGLSPNFTTLVCARVMAGVSFALWSISRHVYIAQTVPLNSRGQALSLFGGLSRIGSVLGPLVGGVLAHYVDLRVPFFAQAGVASITALLVLATFRGSVETSRAAGHNIFPALGRTVSDHKQIFMTAGAAAVILQFMRAAREYIIPLWGHDVGLTPDEVGYVLTVSFAIDSMMFPIVGYIMDRWGRKYTGVPAYFLLAASLAVIPLSTDFTTLMLASVLAGLGNGLSSGFVMTMGSDFSPEKNAGEFLGVWRFISDTGGATGPLLIGATAQVLTLGAASVATAGLGGVGVVVLLLLVRETLVKEKPEKVAATAEKEKAKA
jgi:MFS family permease